jgi:hypothetical protein
VNIVVAMQWTLPSSCTSTEKVCPWMARLMTNNIATASNVNDMQQNISGGSSQEGRMTQPTS